MASKITLPFWPTTLDAVQWSADNRIAVLGGESIAILTPRLSKDHNSSGSFWNTTIIKINGFTTAEIPRCLPLPDVHWSPGEELSINTAHAAAWSHIGPGKYGACILAILTTNHVVSIWAADGKPYPSIQWTRQIIVNHAVKDFYRKRKVTNIQVVQRIQAFAWSAPWYPANNKSDNSGRHFVAVSTHGGHILFLQISTPMREIWRTNNEWRATVCGHFDTTSDGDVEMADADQDQGKNGGWKLVADHIAWSSWNPDDTSTLAYLMKGRLFKVRLEISELNNHITIQPAGVYVQPEALLAENSNLTAPLAFTSLDLCDSLIVFGDNIVHQVRYSNAPPSSSSHHLDDRWDPISGLAFTSKVPNGDAETSLQINLSSHVSTLSSETASLKMTAHGKEMSADSDVYWRKELLESREAHSTEHGSGHPRLSREELDKLSQYDNATGVQERVWGIASSPFDDYIAACFTFHPSESLAYAIGAEQVTVVNITREAKPAKGLLLPLRKMKIYRERQVPTETLVFALARSLNLREDDTNMAERDLDNIIRNIEDAMPESVTVEQSQDAIGPNDPLIGKHLSIREHLQNNLLLVSNIRRLRAARISRLVISSQTGQQPFADNGGRQSNLDAEMIGILVESVLAIPNRVNLAEVISEEDPLGWKIRNIYGIISHKLNMMQQQEQARIDTQPNSNVIDPGISGNESLSSSEHCETCNTPIQFESLKWARCSNPQQVHHYPRCALTFLAMQQTQQAQSSMTKSCGLCGLKYLSDEAIFELSQRPCQTQVRRPGEVPLQPDLSQNPDLDAGAQADDHTLTASTARPGSTPTNPEVLENHIGNQTGHREHSTSRKVDPDSSAASSPSMNLLAIALYATCSVCFYCGGQYTD
ncbi:uncharacterized protein K489DRAFT_44707 [Dissoconium aciculare CBS 342.82]|uniref:Transcription factor IIIC 90kDa subunit N-terminal domain-containing protein n=1 Tax=Dissoconium aciculare CBS 342.82 TaxID=1314786 RepID=A0A6J3LYX3_9PEZI|nr:uncharacterized protein K489DRAFT_44707 [Dissoconium aciculare CBS 342.82]KAF1820848.1 hypothetical protein K489DRAFT_44707 [Dissoconium aciculare CBS 342.82]